MEGIVILGFPKCGTTSLMQYLAKKNNLPEARDGGFYTDETNPVVQRREWCYLPFEEQMKRFRQEFGNPSDFKLIFITRDPVERIWSGWEAWNHYYKDMTFEEYLNLDTEKYEGGLLYLGEVNPVKQIDYERWIQPWKDYDVEVYELEEIRKDPLFPQTNSLKKSDIPDKYYEITKSILKK